MLPCSTNRGKTVGILSTCLLRHFDHSDDSTQQRHRVVNHCVRLCVALHSVVTAMRVLDSSGRANCRIRSNEVITLWVSNLLTFLPRHMMSSATCARHAACAPASERHVGSLHVLHSLSKLGLCLGPARNRQSTGPNSSFNLRFLLLLRQTSLPLLPLCSSVPLQFSMVRPRREQKAGGTRPPPSKGEKRRGSNDHKGRREGHHPGRGDAASFAFSFDSHCRVHNISLLEILEN